MDIGFYGKLPSHGDFLRRRIADSFVDAWDRWLQQCMDASRTALGGRWLDIYLTSPAWRFVGAAGACGPAPVLGLMVPSVDRVGRWFPLTLVSELPPSLNLLTAVTGTGAFFSAAERLVVETLAAEPVDFEDFDARLVSLQDELDAIALPRPVVLDANAAPIVNDGAASRWQMPIGSPGTLPQVFEQLLALRLASTYEPMMLWWTEGSSIVEPSCLITQGLPEPDAFAALLDGAWERHRWSSASAQMDPALNEPLNDPAPALRFQSAAATNVGKVRESNQDAFLERADVGLWAVADGVGGHRDGEIASRMVCDALADFEPGASLDDMADAVRARVQQVNEHLVRTAGRARLSDHSATTVVTLVVRGGSCAILWAGDSRVYRWRSGRLERLTRDHSVAESTARPAPHEAHVVTRAVGVDANLVLDQHRDDVQAGDRFLLCSDGLTHTLDDARIAPWLETADVRSAVDGLIGATLDAGAPDNVTVLAVFF